MKEKRGKKSFSSTAKSDLHLPRLVQLSRQQLYQNHHLNEVSERFAFLMKVSKYGKMLEMGVPVAAIELKIRQMAFLLSFLGPRWHPYSAPLPLIS